MSTLLHVPFDEYVAGLNWLADGAIEGAIYVLMGSATLSAAQSKYGGKSLLCSGSGGNVASDRTLLLKTGDFTAEAWVYCVSRTPSYQTVLAVGAYSVGVQFYITASSIETYINSVRYSVAATVPLNGWHHIAWCRSSGTLRTFLNGTLVGTNASATGNIALNNVSIGGVQSTEVFNGYIDDVRVSDTALYTADFTPPAAFPITTSPITPTTTLTNDAIHLSEYRVPDASIAYQIAERGDYPLYYRGRGRIAATVAIKGTPNQPVARRVRLHEQRSGSFVAETWSDNAGNYVFDYLDPTYTYYAVSFDHTGAYQGVVADQLVPEIF